MSRPKQLPSGSWRIRYIDHNGRRKSETYLSFAEAKHRLDSRNVEARQIKDGIRPAPPTPRPFSELCDEYLLKRTIQKRRQQDDQSIISVHLRPFFGSTMTNQIRVEHVDDYKIAKKQGLHPKTIHHHLTLLITILNYGRERGWLADVPKIKKPKIVLFDKDFRYLKNQSEIERFLLAANEEGPMIHALYSTAVFTGMRAGELAGLKWADVDLERRLITIERSYDGPRKGGAVGYSPILDPLLPILTSWKILSGGSSIYVFPNQVSSMHGPSSRAFQEVLKRTLDRAEFPKELRHKKLRHYIVFHDLRHTFASYWMRMGGDIFKLQKILGHKSVQMTMRYSHLSPDAFAEDYKRFGNIHTGGTLAVIHDLALRCAEEKNSTA